MKRCCAAVVFFACAAHGARATQGEGAAVPSVPLCAGLTIVTAVSESDGNYESIKKIESVNPNGVSMTYSADVRCAMRPVRRTACARFERVARFRAQT